MAYRKDARLDHKASGLIIEVVQRGDAYLAL